MGRIAVIGVGPGSSEYLTPIAKKAVEKAEVVIGGKRQLLLFPDKKQTKVIGKDLDEVLKFIKKNRDKKIAVLTSGDPGFFSILGLILENFPKEEIEVIPGISSMQLGFAKAKMAWHDAEFISLHGRGTGELLNKAKNHRKLAILTDEHMPPNSIAALLLDKGINDRAVAVCEGLSQPTERVVKSSLKDISKESFSENCVMVIFDEMGL
ncbi:MAG: precorrin-6y C5,15-methyltransferase (decarboxylating) subunit CbiE [Candidatus Hydrothermarchaeales archaeon]